MIRSLRWVTTVASDYSLGGSSEGFVVEAGADSSCVVLHVPHSSTAIPSWVRSKILLEDAALARELELMTDAQTDLIAEAAADRAEIRPWVFRNALSRLVVDPERFPDTAQELMAAPEIGMGAVYSKTAHLEVLRSVDAEHKAALLETYFHPYAQGLSDVVGHVLRTHDRVTIIDIHSFPAEELPYERLHHPDARRPQLCLGTDPFHTPDWLVEAARVAFASVSDTVLNEPFAGTYVPLDFYGTDPRVTSIMIEVRRDTYVGQAAAIRELGRSLAALVQAVQG